MEGLLWELSRLESADLAMQGTWFAFLIGELRFHMLHSNRALKPQLEFMVYDSTKTRCSQIKNIYISKKKKCKGEEKISTPHTTLWKIPFQPKKGASGLHPQHVSELLDAGQLCVCVCVCVWVRAWVLLVGGMTPRKIFPTGG